VFFDTQTTLFGRLPVSVAMATSSGPRSPIATSVVIGDDARFPALRFRSSVQIGSSSIFPFLFGQSNGATERQCEHDYVNGLRKWKRIRLRMNGNVMLETRHANGRSRDFVEGASQTRSYIGTRRGSCSATRDGCFAPLAIFSTH